ncbi:type IV toxin-antitoxin system YeeU family antitoxin [Shigella flexneri]|nr:type IV toxin-antitoxin system YeeU family antitoxin [Shigella flexneri]
MSNKIPTVNHDITEPWWGLKRSITPCFGARLVQSGNCLHYLADRASITGQFSDGDLRHLDQAFPLLLKQLELMLTSGELLPAISTVSRSMQRADLRGRLLGSHGYVYLAIYPTPAATA